MSRPAVSEPRRWAPLAAWLLGAALLSASALRPMDFEDWRAADLSSIARNFHRESMNPLLPRIDWRGDGPGYTEMELPVLPWLMAASYAVIGEQPRVGRGIALLASLATLTLFLALARDRLPPLPAAVAVLWLATNPVLLPAATDVRAEPFMLLGMVGAVLAFTRWLRSHARRDYALALVATAFAILAKLSALQLGLLFTALVLRERGWRALSDRELWLFAALALLPALLWYGHAHQLWLTFGNSMGLSNQDHFVGWNLLADRQLLGKVLERQLLAVFTPAGAVLVLAAAVLARPRRWLELEVWWLAAGLVFLLAAAPTASRSWALYYHVVTVPPAALLIGGAVDGLQRITVARTRWREGLRIAAALALCLAFVQGAGPALAALADGLGEREPSPLERCARRFAPHLPPDALLLVTGGSGTRSDGRRANYNRPYFFYWLDRRGFQPRLGELDPERVAEFASRGAGFFVAERRALARRPGLEQALRARYPVAASCEAALLFDLRAGPGKS